MEGVNARDLTPDLITEPIDLLVSDISFVSVTKVLAAPLALCTPNANAVILFKTQFEVGRQNIGKGGIVAVRDGRGEVTILSNGSPSLWSFGNKRKVVRLPLESQRSIYTGPLVVLTSRMSASARGASRPTDLTRRRGRRHRRHPPCRRAHHRRHPDADEAQP